MAKDKGPSVRAAGQEDEPKVPDVSRANKRGEDLWCDLLKRAGLSKVTRPRPKGGRNPVEGSALVAHAAKPRHSISIHSASV
ncbi:hypothetical protein A6033_17690 [Aeromonas veronii]|nr:hypothetical protein A6033_17690 [Aeromonas veronii]